MHQMFFKGISRTIFDESQTSRTSQGHKKIQGQNIKFKNIKDVDPPW